MTALIALVAACLLWGVSFPAMAYAGDGLVALSPARDWRDQLALSAAANTWRFVAASLIAWLLLRPREWNRREWTMSILVGVSFSLGILGQYLSLTWIQPSTSAFITGTCVILVPLWHWLGRGTPLGWQRWLAAILALIGCAVLAQGASGVPRPTPPIPYLSEAIMVLAVIGVSTQIILLGSCGPTVRTAHLTVGMFVVAAVTFALTTVVTGSAALDPRLVITAAADPWWSLAFAWLVFGASLGAFWLMNRFQPGVPDSTAAVIYTAEPLFATMASIVLGREHLTLGLILGAALIMVGLLLAARTPEPVARGETVV